VPSLRDSGSNYTYRPGTDPPQRAKNERAGDPGYVPGFRLRLTAPSGLKPYCGRSDLRQRAQFVHGMQNGMLGHVGDNLDAADLDG
jgi:hypothetical protein